MVLCLNKCVTELMKTNFEPSNLCVSIISRMAISAKNHPTTEVYFSLICTPAVAGLPYLVL